MKKIVIYSGRFQPFGPHHYQNYRHLCEKFGRNNVFIATSDKVDENSPLNFIEKTRIIEQYSDIKNIFKVKEPYKCTEITSLVNQENTAVIFALGSKDKNRLETSRYFSNYTEGSLKPLSVQGYIYTLPHIHLEHNKNEISGTYLRSILPKCNEYEFKSIMGWYNGQIHKMIKERFDDGTSRLYDAIHDFYKPYLDEIQNVLTEADTITKTQLQRIEQYIDKFFKEFNIDIDFQNLYKGTHFFQRLNDPRNESPVTGDDLRKLFKKISIRHGLRLSKLNPGAQGVLKDMESDLNIPFIIKWDRVNQEIDLVPKTIMKKKDFINFHKTPEFVVENIFKNTSKTKHILHLYEDHELTYNDLLEIFKNILTGKIDLYEKVDGQMLLVTYRKGQVLSARNKTTIISPMTVEELATKFQNRGTLTNSFVNAHKDIREAFSSLSVNILEMFEDHNLFLGFEILNPETKNIFSYGDQPKIMLHDLIQFDENGNEIGRFPGSAEKLYNELSARNLIQLNTYMIVPPQKVNINLRYGTDRNFQGIAQKLNQLCVGKMDSFINLKYPELIDFIDELTFDLLNICSNYLSQTDMNTCLEAVNQVNEGLNPVQQIKFAENYQKLQTLIKGQQPNQFEGFVFNHNGKMYKCTGSFRYLNQLLGMKRYN